MLNAVKADHFQALIGQPFEVMPEGCGSVCLTVESVRHHPATRFPDDPPDMREPFSVILTATKEVGLVDSLCTLTLPDLGKLDQVQVSRIAPLSRDPSKAYFQIIFN
jgi:hypothetical protein